MPDAEILVVLKSIDQSLRTLVVIAQRKAEDRVKAAQSKPGEPVASDADLDSKYGNGPVKFDPRDWSGESCKGLPYSDCPPEFLDLMAETQDYFAQRAEESKEVTSNGNPVAPFKRKEAARCRGWAARIRAGRKPAGQPGVWPAEKVDGGW